jgi:beta-glucanase (GH16 family)
MFSFWLIGTETDPAQSAEICIVELFGHAMHPDGSADVGSGVHAFRDPNASEDFATNRRHFDPAEYHEYSVRWSREHAITFIDGEELRYMESPPYYPMQLMIAVFDFPDEHRDQKVISEPELIVDWITWKAAT